MSISLASITYLSISLYGDKSALELQNKVLGNSITELTTENKDLLRRVSEKSSEIALQNKIAEQNKIDTTANINAVKKEKIEIEAKYKILRASLNQWKGDNNATSCQNAISFVNSLSP
jgi:hypothetical protein